MELTDEQWEVLGPLIPKPSRRKYGKGRPRRDHEKYLKASVGYCEPARSGLIYLSVIRPTKRVIGVFKSGRGTACCGRF
jgi:transposase